MKTVVKVEHKGEAHLVGKVFRVDTPDGLVDVFYIEDRSPTQYGRPGLDLAVLELLTDAHVRQVHHYRGITGELAIAPLAAFVAGHLRTVDGRSRRMLEPGAWEVVAAGRWYKPPYLTTEVLVRARAASGRTAPSLF